jgi:SAM-dependent methyltransferase
MIGGGGALARARGRVTISVEVGDTPRSIAFDPAVEYYDETRAQQPATQAAIIAQLVGELRGRGRCLEVGIGTGRIGLDLHRQGIPMAGVDLSAAMMRRLVEKAGGSPPFPLAVADAMALPLADDGVAAALVCHVLHLVDPWQRVVDELVRAVRPGGVILVEHADRSTGPAGEAARAVQRRFWAETRHGSRPVFGLRDLSILDPAMSERGFGARVLPTIVERTERTLDDLIGRLEAGILSGCWGLSPEERRSAAAATRGWALQEFGSLDRPITVEQIISWHAYDAPGGG